MSIQTILLLIGIALLLGLLSRKWQRVNTLMTASIFALYWLQPESSLRYQSYWLPALSLGLIILSWAVTSEPQSREPIGTIKSLLLVCAIYGLLVLLDNFQLGQPLGFNRFPPLLSQVAGLLVILGLPTVLALWKKSHNSLTWLAFTLLLFLFILLKSPPLTLKVAWLWRTLAGQSPKLAAASELQWLGYSYIAFRLLHTIRDKQSGRLPAIALNEYIAYVLFFPSLLAGPIARVNQVLDEIRQPAGEFRQNVLRGSERLIQGLFKKFVLADSLAVFALSPANAGQISSTAGHWILLYAYSLQIYLDFSGYTDIAIGMGYFFGIKLPENFNKPYQKPNLTQFWNNWHMTLTNWFRAYFFNPLSRMLRKEKLPAFFTLLIAQISTMVLVGLWHGITLNFAFWGAWHGLGLLIQNRWSSFIKGSLPIPGQRPGLDKTLNILGTLLTFHYVTLGWIWFVLPTPSTAARYLISLFGIAQ